MGRMYFLCSTAVRFFGLALFFGFTSLFAAAQDMGAQDSDVRAGLTCGQGRSIGLDFCYDATKVEPGLPLGDLAYVLMTQDRTGFITVSLIDRNQGLPGLDPTQLMTPTLDPRYLPMGPSYVYQTKITLIDPDAARPEEYKATLSTDSDFGFQVTATRLGNVPGGTVRLTLMTLGQEGDLDGLTQAFAQVSNTMILNP